MQVDVLTEIGNIGIGSAVTSLSRLIGRKVGMSVPIAKLLDFSEVASILGSAEVQVYGILINFGGDLSGIMMFILTPDSAESLIKGMMGDLYVPGDEFNELQMSALEEIGNILSSSYLSALGTLINKKVVPSVPHISKDMAGAILSVPAIAFGIFSDQVMFIESKFDVEGINPSPTGYFLLVPDEESLKLILSALGVE
jgi:chemotaxis protein CheC